MSRTSFPARRVREPELMDQPGLDPGEHRSALDGLGRINVMSGVVPSVWAALRTLPPAVPGRPLRILDLACGGGHVAIGLARRANREGVATAITGCDLSSFAVEYARELARRSGAQGVSFEQRDVLNDALPQDVDAACCSLFVHHLDDDDVVRLLARMAAVARRVVVSDLRRTRLGYFLAWTGCRLLSRSRIVHVDGGLSVAAAYSTAEARRLAERAGLRGAQFFEQWPQRWLLSWDRP